MNNIELIKPNKNFIESYYQACQESWELTTHRYIIHNPADYEVWKNTILHDYENFEKGINLPAGFAPYNTYWAVCNGEYVGTVVIRPKLNEALKNFGGHFGIFLRASKRGFKGLGYGVKLSRLAYYKTKELIGDEPVLVTCFQTTKFTISFVRKFADIISEEEGIYSENGIDYKTYKFWIK